MSTSSSSSVPYSGPSGSSFRPTCSRPSRSLIANSPVVRFLGLLTVSVIANRDLRSDVIELQTGNWASHMDTGNRYFIKFYAPWCAYCKKLKPVWEQLATDVHASEDPLLSVKIAELDCTRHADICTKVGVRGYPTLMWVNDQGELYKYSGRMDSKEEFTKFIKKQVEDPHYGVGKQILSTESTVSSTSGSKSSSETSTKTTITSSSSSSTSTKTKTSSSSASSSGSTKSSSTSSSTSKTSKKSSKSGSWAGRKYHDSAEYPAFYAFVDFIIDEFDPLEATHWPKFFELSNDASLDVIIYLQNIYDHYSKILLFEIPKKLDKFDAYITSQQDEITNYLENKIGPYYAIDEGNAEGRRWALIKNMYVWGTSLIGCTALFFWILASRMALPPCKEED